MNWSLGDDKGYDQVEARAFNDAFARDGVLMVAVAGNDGTNDYAWPASYPSVISVGTVYNNGKRDQFSQSNDQMEVAGLGINIKSTVPYNGYKSYSTVKHPSRHHMWQQWRHLSGATVPPAAPMPKFEEFFCKRPSSLGKKDAMWTLDMVLCKQKMQLLC